MTAMTTLYAKGRKLGTMKVAYLWGLGSYKYEIEVMSVPGEAHRIEREVFEVPYAEAIKKFEKVVDKVVLL